MTPRWIAYLLFLAILLVLGSDENSDSTSSKGTGAVWLAAVTLPPNTLLETNHLQRPNLPNPISAWGLPNHDTVVGKYVLATVLKGKEIAVANLSPFPQVTNQVDQTLLSFRAQEQMAVGSSLNAGAKVYVCGPDPTNSFGPYTVEAKFGKSESATLLIRVAKADAQAILKIAKPELRLAALP